MKLIGITGRKRSGKDALATIINKRSQGKYTIVSFADPMRKIMSEVCLFPPQYDYESMKEEPILEVDNTKPFFFPRVIEMLSYNTDGMADFRKNGVKFVNFMKGFQSRKFSPREFLQKLGTEFGRNELGENIWVDTLIHSLQSDGNYIIADVRFNNEAEAIIKAGGTIFKTVRPELETGHNEDKHQSEVGIDSNFISFTIEANSLSELENNYNKTIHPIGCLCEECSDGDEHLQYL